MNRPLLVATAVTSCLVANACGDAGGATPAAPTATSASQAAAPKPPPLDAVSRSDATGIISMIGTSPGSGASLLVGECRFGNITRTCADGWRGTFNVSLDREMEWAVLTVSFYNGDVRCGYAADVQQRVPPGQTVTFRPSRISLSDEFGTFPTPCRLPATTTRIVAVLWSDTDWTTQLTQEFASSYVFTRP